MVQSWHHTTICAVRRGEVTAMACDGQVTLGATVLKHGASKLRRLGNGRVLAGFAGSVADALALFTRFETKFEEFAGTWSGRRSSWRATGVPTEPSGTLRR